MILLGKDFKYQQFKSHYNMPKMYAEIISKFMTGSQVFGNLCYLRNHITTVYRARENRKDKELRIAYVPSRIIDCNGRNYYVLATSIVSQSHNTNSFHLASIPTSFTAENADGSRKLSNFLHALLANKVDFSHSIAQ